MMEYSTFIPDSDISTIVECYWSVVGRDTEKQKIIPDGFPEIIFHFGDPYELLSAHGHFEKQGSILLSGQISRPIVLRATGQSDVFGIKFRPAAIWKLFRINMSEFRDRVVPLDPSENNLAAQYEFLKTESIDNRVDILNNHLRSVTRSNFQENEIVDIIKTIEQRHGNVLVDELCSMHNISLRRMQRSFNQQIGITAKQYCRLARFKMVYSLLQKPSLTTSDSVFLTGYFDQPHFNKEFREFTDDNPANWFSKENAFSNLFLNR
jgi:AraC-like DNA-binding protein